MDTPNPMRPLDGVRVLDFSHALAGPYATLLLSDYGADVYKLEAPGGSDMGRGWGPPFIGPDSAFFVGLNRGKRGVSINLKKPGGIELCLRLADRMDVLIENFRPGTMDRLGLGYGAVHARNPRLVYCSISGYGQTGPSRDDPAMDLIVQCSSGLVSITGSEDGELARCGYSVADVTAGLFSVIGILMALRARESTGLGQRVDISMQDCMISTMTSNYMYYLASGVDQRPLGTGFATIAPYRVFDAADRGFSVAVGSEKLWSAFCAVIGRPDLEHHPDYANNRLRTIHRPALEGELGEVFAQRSADAWVDTLRAAGIPATPVRTLSDVVGHPQSAARGMFPEIQHPTAGPQRVTGPAIKFSETPGREPVSALTELLELDETTIDGLFQSGALFPMGCV
jgi:crotonobetainyl-CoA:carnitine CoA-transferase CaiB-like acyl-CoA transferase